MKIGVLAVQGAFAEHCKAMEKLGVSSRKHMLRYATLLRQETQEQ